MKKVSIHNKLSLIKDYWTPVIAGELNGQQVKLVKFKGEFIWHKHDNEDEMFYVVEGEFKMEFRDKSVTIKKGEFIIVPRGVEHKPVAEKEVAVMLFEPASTVNTGNIDNEFTVNSPQRI
ncbi:cupin domain-containing protein [Abyssalbus ytuae]|uniref:Cupin domain-containing protein n=1 Tax=Abyssalbus ytuae TaxID=2926907 RepID=A0A9E7CY71_9FLAO|nr:cupin domain-containing protein [Abyssalbus ytuae]UOB16330.1 cupin domain-containing protein [Abyssalbus ytuae]